MPEPEVAPLSETPPQIEQAKSAARDGLTRRELTNLLCDLWCTDEVLVDGEDDSWRPTTITVGFSDDGGRGTDGVALIMARAGWQLDGVTFAPYNRVRFVERGAR
jgi:hypothetical protein